ncbi:MAG: bifunctional folylpolyglutamate synthase/dihydrofolate synthase [Actinomycetales bacterium]|nr:bifunctional folylpolyglutamate synthase/dihydrofolate synthase [Actinomycetales bacterium]
MAFSEPPGPGDERADRERFAEVIAGLEQRWPEQRIEPSLVRIASVVQLLGDPQRSYPVIHVTGTNGKTSTARMIESLLRSFGLRTGLFTSPHLADARERICLEGQPISMERFTAAWDDVRPYVELVDARSVADGGIRLSYFEAMTAIAFAAFADAPVDVAVVEVGMGGEWDATNVAVGQVAVVTPIGLDHTEYLGDTVEQIAVEKAGIIKPGAQAVLARQEPGAAEVLLARCAAVDAVPIREGMEFAVLDREMAVGGQVLTVQAQQGPIDNVFVPLFGDHQAQNAAVALAAVEAFLSGEMGLDLETVREGFMAATSPGRLQIVRRSPTVLVDAAHNPHGARALGVALQESFDFATLVGVVGILAEKDAQGMLIALEEILDSIVVTAPASPRAMPAEDLAGVAAEIFGEDRVWIEHSLLDAIDRATTLAEEVNDYGGAGVLVTGSVVLAGEAIRLMGGGR